jgi:hypothetical protein
VDAAATTAATIFSVGMEFVMFPMVWVEQTRAKTIASKYRRLLPCVVSCGVVYGMCFLVMDRCRNGSQTKNQNVGRGVGWDGQRTDDARGKPGGVYC